MSNPAPSLVALHEAAAMAERNHRTLRRWIKEGKLTRHEGESANGGTPPLLIDKNELLKLLVNQQPRKENLTEDPKQGEAQKTQKQDQWTWQPHLAEMQMKVIQAEAATEIAKAEGRIISLEVELSGVRDRLISLERQLVEERERSNRKDLEIGEWKGRYDAKEAELSALRAQKGLSWWNRLLTTTK